MRYHFWNCGSGRIGCLIISDVSAMKPPIPEQPQPDKSTSEVMHTAQNLEYWSTLSDRFTAGAAIFGLIAALVAFAGLWVAKRSGSLKDAEAKAQAEAFEKYKISADDRISEANKVAATANERAEELQVTAATLQKEAEELRHRTVVAELELEKLIERNRPRTVTDEQAKRFAAVVAQHPGIWKSPVSLYTNASGAEVRNYIERLHRVLDANGFGGSTKGGLDLTTSLGSPSPGVSLFLLVHRHSTVEESAALLQKSLEAAGIVFEAGKPEANLQILDRGDIVLYVTEKR